MFNAFSRQEAGKRFKSFGGSLNRRYPKMACALTEYYDFPKAITRPIRSADIIDSLLTEHSAAKIIYSRVIELSSNWWNRTLKDSLPAGKRFRKCLT